MTHYMIVGKVPFFNTNKEKMWEGIKTAELVIPEEVPEVAAAFIAETMRRTPADRLGAVRTKDCRAHAFFAKLDFEALLCREVPVPEEATQYTPQKDSEPVRRHDIFGRTNHCLRVFKCLMATPVEHWDYTRSTLKEPIKVTSEITTPSTTASSSR